MNHDNIITVQLEVLNSVFTVSKFTYKYLCKYLTWHYCIFCCQLEYRINSILKISNRIFKSRLNTIEGNF